MNVGDMVDFFRTLVSEEVDPDDKRETAVYWKTKRILKLLNTAQGHCSDKIARINQSYFINFFRDSGSDEYLLPEDFLRAIEVKSGGRSIAPMNTANADTEWGDYYYFRDNNLVLPRTDDVEMKYIRKLPELKYMLDISQIPDQFHEYMVMYAAQYASMIDEAFNLSAQFLVKFKELEFDMFGSANDRQSQEPRYVHADIAYA